MKTKSGTTRGWIAIAQLGFGALLLISAILIRDSLYADRATMLIVSSMFICTSLLIMSMGLNNIAITSEMDDKK